MNRTPSLLGSGLASAASLLALAELHPPPGVLMGRRRKPPSSQTQTAAAAGSAGCNRSTEYTFVLLESCHKALELRIAKTEPLIIPRAWCQLKNQQDRFPLFPCPACVAKPDLHQSLYLQNSPAEATHLLPVLHLFQKQIVCGPKGQGVLACSPCSTLELSISKSALV